MSIMLLQCICAFSLVIVGIYCLSISIFYPHFLGKDGPFGKKYHGDQGRIIYIMLSVFFLIGGITLFLYKII